MYPTHRTSSDWFSTVLGPSRPAIDSSQKQIPVGHGIRDVAPSQSDLAGPEIAQSDCLSNSGNSILSAPLPPASPAQQPPAPLSARVSIARHPNSFFLFRSKFVKEADIPKDVENHQRYLSQMAGQVWALLPEDEKLGWKLLAKEARRCQSDTPSYKLARAARRAKAREAVDLDAIDQQEELKKAVMLRQYFNTFKDKLEPPIHRPRGKQIRTCGPSSIASPPSHIPYQNARGQNMPQAEIFESASFKSFDRRSTDWSSRSPEEIQHDLGSPASDAEQFRVDADDHSRADYRPSREDVLLLESFISQCRLRA